MSARDDEWARLLEVAVWGFEGEPQKCARCDCFRFTEEHSPTCPMPAEVIAPANKLLERLAHGRVTNRALDQRLKKRLTPADETPPTTGDPEAGRRVIGGVVHNHRYVDNPTCGERLVGECLAATPADETPRGETPA